jgi:hypothetical protein
VETHGEAILIRAGIAALVALGSATHASARGVEVNAMGGYRFGGGFVENATGRARSLDDGGSFGLVVNVDTSYEGQIEASWDRQVSHVAGPGFDVNVDAFQLGGLYLWGESEKVRPFLLGTVGAVRYAPQAAGVDDVTRFGFALGLGAKLFVSPRFGFRVEARTLATVFGTEGNLFCTLPGVCLLRATGQVLWQGEVRAGLVLRFP